MGYEFQQRPDGLAGLLKTYHLPIQGSPKTMDLGLLYKALEQGQVSMVAGNATDGQLSVLDAVVLQDDQRYFPPYDCGLVVRADILKDNPPLRQALVELAGRFTDQTMRKLNYQVDGEHRPIRDVAEQFLREAGLLSLIGDQQIFGKGPFRIDPLGFTEESRPLSETGNLLDAEFVAGFRPDRFPFSECTGEVRGPNRYGLVPCRAEMHFDPTVPFLIPDVMFEVPCRQSLLRVPD